MTTTLTSVSPATVIDRVLNNVLTGPERWTRGCSARDSFDNAVCYDSFNASKFCMVGAIGYALTVEMGLAFHGVSREEGFWLLLEKVRSLVAENLPLAHPHNPAIDIPHFNDHDDTTFDDVRAVFEKAWASA